VRHRIRRDVRPDYEYAAQALNDCGVSVVSLQYDPRIWGGDGSYVLDFARALRVPMTLTLHKIPASPTQVQRDIIGELTQLADTSVVLSKTAADALTGTYGLSRRRISVIPYGVADLPLLAPDAVKPRLGLRDRAVILSFGLLKPHKGFDAVIQAMPAVVGAIPNARYIVLGASSLDGDTTGDESYRVALESQVARLGLGDHVAFVDRFVGRVELGTWLEAADVFVAPARNDDRTDSGTLAYAMGAGKAIVSTPSDLASELLGGGRGRLVATDSAAELAAAIVDLLTDTETRTAMGRRAWEASRGMVWWEVGRQYRQVFEQALTRTPDRQLRGRSSGRTGSTRNANWGRAPSLRQ
jgi:glycosyltransferase involved in cell wall biosynthesis